MRKYPRVHADGESLEIELEASLTVVSHVGDPILVQSIAHVWSTCDTVEDAIAHVSDLLARDGHRIVDDCVLPLLRGLPQQHLERAATVPFDDR
ncbi:hypothetical protein [Chelatococcus sp. YT9]|uniref:hypothetical protein n=1 Tax=Chelatococcus sp. YT9 TaxID=2835635 RepID=UPI001BCF3C58|nr:hypothetical protein [Chelatococcus sp. YT9]MBS7699085.1 hypothetical protein [Chelatococcus sp. YT9]